MVKKLYLSGVCLILATVVVAATATATKISHYQKLRSKKGIMKTMEAIISIFLVFFILSIFLPPAPTQQVQEPQGFLNVMASEDDFRNCVIAKNTTCINSTIGESLPDHFDYVFNLSDKAVITVTGLPDVQTFSESVYFAGNVTNASTTILRVFYWVR